MPARRYYKKIFDNSIEYIIDEENERIYKSSYMLNAEGSRDVLLIGRAPKSSTWYKCDRIVQRTVNYLYAKENYFNTIRRIVVVNLFVTIDYGFDWLEDLIKSKGSGFVEGNDSTFSIENKIIKNDEIIKDEIYLCDDILLAWGEPISAIENIYEERIEFILKEIRNHRLESNKKKSVYKIGSESINGYPKHPLAWSYKDELLECF